MPSGAQTSLLFKSLPESGASPFPCFERWCSFALQDWENHKPFCRPGATVSSIIPANSTDIVTVERRSNPLEDTISKSFQPGAGCTISINVGGGGITQFSSETIPPQMMREMKEGLENGS